MKLKISQIWIRTKYSLVNSNYNCFLMGLFLLIGILIRLRQFLFNRSLWSDEGLLALNFLNRSLLSLVTQPLQNNQATPIGFVVLTKIFVRLFGNYDIVLRLIPFLTGILALVCVYFLSLRILKHTAARLVFIGLFAFSPILIYYSSEFKQYSSDFFFAVLLVWVGLEFSNWHHGFILLTVVGAISVLFSYISIFVLLSIGSITGLDLLFRKKYSQFFQFGLVVSAWLASFSLVYWFSMRFSLSNSYLFNFWRDGFPPDPALSIKTVGWLVENCLGIIYFSFQQASPISQVTLKEWYGSANLFLAFLVLVGAIWQNKRSLKLWLICIVIIFVNLVMAFMHLYPFRSRLVLYLTVIIYLFAAMLIEQLWNKNFWYTHALGLMLGVILLVPFIFISFQIVVSPDNFVDIKNTLAYVEKHRQNGDSLAYNAWAEAPFKYYSRSYGLDGIQIVDQVPKNLDPLEFRQKICQKGVTGRLWIIITHDLSNRFGFLAGLEGNVEFIDSWGNESVGRYLVNLKPEQICAF